MKLADVEARFYALVTARESVAATVAARGPEMRRAIEELVDGDARLPAIARLEIYADMYFARIHEVLGDEYAKTAAALGAAGFHRLVLDYLDACRPDHPSMREVGARLPAFLAAHPTAARRPWLAELARLERARLEMFDSADAQILTLEALRTLPPEWFAALHLRLVPSHALCATRFDLVPLWRSDDPSAAVPEPSPTALLVWRRELEVLHRAVDGEEADWLRRLEAGDVRFEALCAGLGRGRGDEAAATRAFELVGRWARDGLLRADD
ncbi:MAG TPA: putative DNA-binding domain-containing protein [Polyangia bacterium]|nr:putative DNA-binding domain-containing protein [Polyangia bacterium]